MEFKQGVSFKKVLASREVNLYNQLKKAESSALF
jgi:hypothetical protein